MPTSNALHFLITFISISHVYAHLFNPKRHSQSCRSTSYLSCQATFIYYRARRGRGKHRWTQNDNAITQGRLGAAGRRAGTRAAAGESSRWVLNYSFTTLSPGRGTWVFSLVFILSCCLSNLATWPVCHYLGTLCSKDQVLYSGAHAGWTQRLPARGKTHTTARAAVSANIPAGVLCQRTLTHLQRLASCGHAADANH